MASCLPLAGLRLRKRHANRCAGAARRVSMRIEYIDRTASSRRRQPIHGATQRPIINTPQLCRETRHAERPIVFHLMQVVPSMTWTSDFEIRSKRYSTLSSALPATVMSTPTKRFASPNRERAETNAATRIAQPGYADGFGRYASTTRRRRTEVLFKIPTGRDPYVALTSATHSSTPALPYPQKECPSCPQNHPESSHESSAMAALSLMKTRSVA